MYQCCIFDLDGTIINTIESLAYSISLTMEHFGYAFVDLEHTRQFVGDGYKKFVERALIYSGNENLSHYQEALTIYEKTFAKHCLYRIQAYEGMPEFLKFLKEKGIKTAVLTNKRQKWAVECVKMVYGEGFFDLITGEGGEFPPKPDPAGAFWTAKTLGTEPFCCLYFGDTNTDMQTGINAGMDTVGVTWGFRERAELEAFHPKYIIDKPGEIYSVFE